MNTFANMNGPSAGAAPVLDIASSATISTLPVFGRTGAWRPVGIALAFAEDDSDACGEDRFDLLLVDAADAVVSRLGPFCEEEVVALWRDCAAKSGLPRMIVKEDGALAVVSAQLGPVALGRTRMRRRVGLLNGRRPRFLVRRKTGALPVRPLIHRESEIISGARC
ncbi:DUF6101 family protein [Methylobacterium sp. J-068]|uniref:DUF6101 family protein n=1 Tax=Methylobacterium sp. J-068 TaxID=2836649 RepID=UPI001FBB04AD|nr:DUF6101 family protein [Methylobacterium sp. J-068]MCJ2033901.1 DUF6101 family protein [Methylobacterium sp. J-068]